MVAGQNMGELLWWHAQPEGRGQGKPSFPAPVERKVYGVVRGERGIKRRPRQGQTSYWEQIFREMETPTKRHRICEP